jgi:hypothetical protein
MADQTRLPPALRHKGRFPYECASREAIAVWWSVLMWPVIGRATCLNFGNIRDYFLKVRLLLEKMRSIAAMLFQRVVFQMS